MLSAKRDPFHPGAPETPNGGSRVMRTMTAVQMIGALLAIPVGAGSAYSIYRANFSQEISCQGLRGNIVSMLDKTIDPATLRMLVRRDVETFEQKCAAVDPDATAAFKNLLAAEKVAEKPAAVTVVKRVEPRPEPRKAEIKVEAKAEPKAEHKLEAKVESKAEPKVEAKAEPKVEPKADAKTEAVASDTQWLAAVRGALVNHPPEPAPAAQRQLAPPETMLRAPAAAAPAMPAALPVAPPLEPAIAVAPAPKVVDPNRPVPPGSIPDGAQPALEARAEAEPEPTHNRSRLGELIGRIPLLGRAVDRIEPKQP